MPSKPKNLAYSVEVIDKTGKAIHTSRTVLGALKEARDAYKAKRAERKADREAEKAARLAAKQRAYEEELRLARRARRDARRASEDDHRADERRRERRQRQERRLTEAGVEINDNASETSSLYSHAQGNMSQLTLRSQNDVGLPPLPPPPTVEDEQDDHLTALFYQVQDIIDHAAAAQSSVITLVDALRRDPETLAMVGLTLAEISTVIAKLSPGALAGVKASWPMVFAFLASPQFAIIAGVGIGTTVVLIGGYKIIKKMIGGEPAKPPEIIDMGGRVVDEGDVQAITSGVEEVRITDEARERERTRSHSRKAIKDKEDPLAFGHEDRRLQRRHTHHDRESRDRDGESIHSRRSIEEVEVRPTPRRHHTVAEPKPSAPITVESRKSEVPELAFDIPKPKKFRLRSGESRSRSSRSETSSVAGDDKDRKSSKRERDIVRELEEGGKYMVVRRKK